MASATSNTITDTASTWDISTDIYNIVDEVEDVKKRYIEDEDETTLALGLFGFISDLESKKIQSAIIQTGELGNEMFPTRAKLDKNILTHAIYQNVTGINATPAYCTVTIGVKLKDLDNYMENNKFYFDRDCAIYIGDYEFHFDYDIILQKSQTASMANPVYSARYIMDEENPISDVTAPYLKQPYQVNLDNYTYVMFQATVRQVTLEWTEDKMVTDSIIENKSFLFEFSNQLADFIVYVTENGVTTRITPVFYGAPVEADVEYYCWYLYINETTVRITFDRLSYVPGLNADIKIEAQTTLGAEGNFTYKTSTEYFYTDFSSSDYGYTNVTCYMLPVTDSYDGKDQKSSEELKKIIPKFALSRGYLTTETDLDNYFNLINTDTNRLKLQKKVDNQLYRIWYCYFLIKDDYGNIIPTNTFDIEVNVNDGSCYKSEDGRMVLPAGTYFAFDPVTRVGTVIDEANIPTLYSDEFFSDDVYYYICPYNIAICTDPLYAAFYLTNINKDSYYIFDWVNEYCELQFVANRNNIIRKLLTERNMYIFTFSMQQSLNADYNMYYTVEDEEGNETVVNNMKCIIVFYKNDVPYRYAECYLTDYDISDNYRSDWRLDLETDNGLDLDNCLKLLDLGVPGSTDTNYGYFDTSTTAYLYTLAKLDAEYGRYDLDDVVPGLEGYSVTNRYEVEGGIQLFRNYTLFMDTKIVAVDDNTYTMTGIPMVGAHYMMSEDYASYFFDALDDKRAYIEDCLALVENSMDVDLKYFNTYGPSVTYTIGDEAGTWINHVDIEMKFRIKLVSSSDVYTKDSVIEYIKSYVENINDIGDLHIPNLITELETNFSETLVFAEFMNYNDFWLGVQHMELQEVDDPHTVPEFICIRNYYDEDTESLKPCIEVECVS